MRKVRLPGTDVEVSSLIMGTLGLPSTDPAAAHRLLDSYLDAGGNAVDTARVYGTEETVGDWIATRGVRESVVLIGKGGHPAPDGTRRLRPEDVRDDLLTSLDRTRLDRFDLFMLHRDDLDIPVDELVDALDEHVSADRTQAVGVSNWGSSRIETANAYARQSGRAEIVASSANLALAVQNCAQYAGALSISDRPDELEWHRRTQLPLLAWSAQARGFFTSRVTRDAPYDPAVARVYESDANWERRRRAETLAASHGATAAQVALAWATSQAFPCAAIVGPANQHEAAETFAAIDVTLTADELSWLNLETQ